MIKIEKMSKRIRARNVNIDFSKHYTIDEALVMIKDRANAKFDETVEVVFACNIDPRKGDQNIRGMVELPAGTGRSVRIAVFAQGEQAQQARDAGAEIVGDLDLIEEVQKGRIDFDLCIATPPMMAHLSKLGKILGPKQLMPNPKLGTVAKDIKSTVEAIKKGRIEIKCDKDGNLGLSFGKVKFSDKELSENFKSVYEVVAKEKPAGIKGNFINSIYLSTTMGPSVKLQLSSI